MSDNSKIEWTDSTWNPIRARNLATGKLGWYCEHATTGCEFCYAEGMNKRLGTGLPFKPGHRKDVEIFLDEKMLLQPLRWKKPRMIFVCSMTDLFADFVPDESIDKMFAVMALTPQHTYQVLTKRAARMREYFSDPERKRTIALNAMPISCALAREGGHAVRIKLDHFSACFAGSGPLPNVWLGVSAERQQEADERIPLLLGTPAKVRFVSAEPLLGPIDILKSCAIYSEYDRIDWVIAGGESGPNARPMHPDWARSLRDQCAAVGVAYFFKQWGNWKPLDQFTEKVIKSAGVHAIVRDDGRFIIDTDIADPPRTVFTFKMGKHDAGRLLDGIEHNAMPQATR